MGVPRKYVQECRCRACMKGCVKRVCIEGKHRVCALIRCVHRVVWVDSSHTTLYRVLINPIMHPINTTMHFKFPCNCNVIIA